MLRALTVHNLAIIERLTVEFGPRLNVISGETGAGKSILIAALGMLLGGRAHNGLVRRGSERAHLSGAFEIGPAARAFLASLDLPGPEEGEDLLIRRSLSVQGRSRAWIHGHPVTMSTLRQLGACLLDHAGQHDQQQLLLEDQHRSLLDAFGQLAEQRAVLERAYESVATLRAERDRLRRQAERRHEREDFLRFVLEELRSVAPREGEDQELVHEAERLRSAEDRRRACAELSHLLEGESPSALELLDRAIAELEPLHAMDEGLSRWSEALAEARELTADAARGLGSYTQRIERDPERLQAAEERLDELIRLQRKHRVDQAGLVRRLAEFERELAQLTGSEKRQKDLDAQIEAQGEVLSGHCAALRRSRQAAAVRLRQLVEQELAELSMPGARFQVEVEPLRDEGLVLSDGTRVGPHGADQVRFLLCANPGELLRPLRQVASGGELSRILLALKVALAEASQRPTMVFDEIDAGLSGEAAEQIGAKLAELSRGVQVLCITHQPQVAALAQHHLRVSKSTTEGRTRTAVVHLDEGERVRELSRMIAGQGASHTADILSRELIQRRTAGVVVDQ